MDLKALREQRNKLVADMRSVIDRADAEKRGLTADENTKLAAMRADAATLRDSILNVEELESEERAAVPESQRQAPRTADERKEQTERRSAFLRFAAGEHTMADIRALSTGSADTFRSQPNAIVLGPEQRAQNTLSLAAGGAVVAPDTSMYGRIVEAMKWFGGMEAAGSEVYTTDTGADMPIATDDDTANVGAIIAEEATQTGASNVAMGQVVLHSYLYSSKIIKVSWQLLQDGSFDIEGYLSRKLGMRLGRIQNQHFTTGTGINQPLGLVTAATVGRQSATGNATSVTADDVLRVIRSVDPAYLPQAKFMMSSSSALQYELLKDGNGQYLWRDGAGFGGLTDKSGFNVTSGNLRGFPVVLNNDMPTMAASAKHTSFGDHSYYKIRRVKAIQLVRVNELYVENGQVGFLAFMRADGGLVDAGQHPVKLIQNSAS